MTSHENFAELSPVERSRRELGEMIIQAVALETLSSDQGNTLGHHLNVPNLFISDAKKRQKKQILQSISETIKLRELGLVNRRFANGRRLGATGMLALAVGDQSQHTLPMQRPELLRAPIIDQLAEKWPRVDRNVILDKTLERDLDWLSEWTVPKDTT